MRNDEINEQLKHHEGRRGRHLRGDSRTRTLRQERVASGAKTFRRGRAIAFLAQLETKRDTLKKQLATAELQAINVQIAGELKATESIIDKFIKVFELKEADTTGQEQAEKDNN